MVKRIFILIIFLSFSVSSFSQTDSTFVDTKYLEDQIYFSLSYSILIDKPKDFSQNGLSGGFTVGFIKDIPLNKQRNFGLGLGLGYAYSAYNQNLKILDNSDFEIIPNEDFEDNQFAIQVLEVPFEFRWRTSTATDYNFWRIYAGLKFGYVIASKSKYSDELNEIKVKNINEIQKTQYGLTLSAGYSTFNLSLYYGLNSLFKNADVNGEAINLKQFNIGLVFYIL